MGKGKADEQTPPPPLHRRATRGQARARISPPSAVPPAPPSPAASSGSSSSSHTVLEIDGQQQQIRVPFLSCLRQVNHPEQPHNFLSCLTNKPGIRGPLFLTSLSQHRLQVEQLLQLEQVQAAVQQQISLQNGNLLNLMDHVASNVLMQKKEEIAHLHVKIQNIEEALQAALQWKDFEMGRYKMLISQLSPMQGTHAQGHGLTNELESTAAENTIPTLICSVCCFRGACMLILPCQHLCACKSCEVHLTLCPICGSAKTNAIEARFG